jgi:hypothetical protein
MVPDVFESHHEIWGTTTYAEHMYLLNFRTGLELRMAADTRTTGSADMVPGSDKDGDDE